MRMWLVGQVFDGAQWEFQGIFSSEERAAAECRAPNWFYTPVQLDEELEAETREFPGMVWPRFTVTA